MAEGKGDGMTFLSAETYQQALTQYQAKNGSQL